MAEVTISIGGRTYQLLCDDGQEPRLELLASRIDVEARTLAQGAPQISEARLLLMSALMVADKLDETEDALKKAAAAAAAQQAAPQPTAQPSLFSDEDGEAALAEIETAITRIAAAKNGGPAAQVSPQAVASTEEQEALSIVERRALRRAQRNETAGEDDAG